MHKPGVEDKLRKLARNEWQLERALELLPSVRKAVGSKGGRIYAQVLTVARSGMSRTIALYIVHKGELVNLNGTLYARVYGDRVREDDAVSISGCGMDMLFEATYRLYRFLFDQKKRPYQQHLNRYRSM
jgi:hypothetical protein